MSPKNVFTSLVLLALGSISQSSFTETSPSLEVKASCEVLNRGTGLGDQLPADILKIYDDVRLALEKNQPQDLFPLFHPKLRVKLKDLQRSFAVMRASLGKRYEVALFRSLRVKLKDSASDVVECGEDRLRVQPHYGYSEQLWFVLQARGEKELGRFVVSAVQGPDWKLGSWHSQVWTHQGCDPDCWAEDARRDAAAGRMLASYIKHDIALKLAASSPQVTPFDPALRRSELIGFYDPLLEQLQKAVGPLPLVKAFGSAFLDDGAGLMVRLEVDPKIVLKELRPLCESVAKKLYGDAAAKESLAMMTGLGGLRCSYLGPGEDMTREGVLGARTILRKQMKFALPPPPEAKSLGVTSPSSN